MKKILVIDVGGSNVKMMISQEEKRRKFPSGPKLGPEEAVEQIKEEFLGQLDILVDMANDPEFEV